MFEKVLHNIPLRSTFQVLGIHFLSEDEAQYCVLTIHKKRDEFSIGKRFETDQIAEVFKGIEPKHPVLLHFSGVGILNKEVELTTNYRQKLLFKSNSDDFYFYELHQEKTIFVSMCRKKVIDRYLKQFKSKKYHIVDIAMGPFVTYILRSFLSDQTIISNLSKITVSQYAITNFEMLNDENTTISYQIDDLTFHTKEIALFAMVVQYHIREEAIWFEAPFLQENKTNFTYYKATKLAGITGISMLLLGILLGHFLLNQYQTKAADEQAMVAEVKEIQENIQLLTQQKQDKEEIIATSGLFNPKFLTSYFYDIGNSVDENTKLSSMAMTPVTKKIRADKEVAFFKNQIHVEGLANNDNDFEQWIARLNKKTWVKKIEIQAYTEVRKSKEKLFLIHIYF